LELGGENKFLSLSMAVSTVTSVTDFVRLDQREHVLHRPDTYVGSVAKRAMTCYHRVNGRMVPVEVMVSPAFLSVVGEIICNATDHARRHPQLVTYIELKYDRDTGSISVENNGPAIPTDVHPEYGVRGPELVFGHMLTGSNFKDDQKRTGAGRNGMGAKLTSIFSRSLTVETSDGKECYRQTWTSNMMHREEPRITASKRKQPYTRVTFMPDYARFNMDGLDADTAFALDFRMLEVSATCQRPIRVAVNGLNVPCRTFRDFVRMFSPADVEDGDGAEEEEDGKATAKRAVPRHWVVGGNDTWEVGVVPVAKGDACGDHLSYVNGLRTYSGGTHLRAVEKDTVDRMLAMVRKDYPAATLGYRDVADTMRFFVNATVVDPTFDRQTKEALTTPLAALGSRYVLTEAELRRLYRSPQMRSRLSDLESDRVRRDMKRTDGRSKLNHTDLPKLDDAHLAGTKEGRSCTLILTEGDSAKALAVACLSVVGRERYGIYPLKGKPLNVRSATPKRLQENEEFCALKMVLGLRQEFKYVDRKEIDTLRYGRVMLFTDADHDGAHICGLVLNMFHTFWPNLMHRPGFLCGFQTPVVKASRGKESLSFYSIESFAAWQTSEARARTGWTVKYYKGLGTNTAAEGREYFRNLRLHTVPFRYGGPEDDSSMVMAFDESQSDGRKKWIAEHSGRDPPDPPTGGTFQTYTEFVNDRLVFFSAASNIRALPRLDGLKPVERKVIHTCLTTRSAHGQTKVAQFAARVAEYTHYHHGEASMQKVVVSMAQDFLGSNNMPLMTSDGQFGTRLKGGDDAASARYIFTQAAPALSLMFPPADNPLLDYTAEEGETAEPKVYFPVLPLLLINGASGIGTGWSTNIPKFNPADLAAIVRLRLGGAADAWPEQGITPWYRGFSGTVERTSDTKFILRGRSELRVGGNGQQELHVLELPPGVWTESVKNSILEMMNGATKTGSLDTFPVTDMVEQHTDTRVHFSLVLRGEAGDRERVEEKLTSMLLRKVTLSNMVILDECMRPRRYSTVREIFDAWFTGRAELYGRRLDHARKEVSQRRRVAEAEVGVVADIVGGRLQLLNAASEQGVRQAAAEMGHSPDAVERVLGFTLSRFTADSVAKLRLALEKLCQEEQRLLSMSWQELWKRDLDALMHEWDQLLQTYQAQEEDSHRQTQDLRPLPDGVAPPAAQARGQAVRAPGTKRFGTLSTTSTASSTSSSGKRKRPSESPAVAGAAKRGPGFTTLT